MELYWNQFAIEFELWWKNDSGSSCTFDEVVLDALLQWDSFIIRDIVFSSKTNAAL